MLFCLIAMIRLFAPWALSFLLLFTSLASFGAETEGHSPSTECRSLIIRDLRLQELRVQFNLEYADRVFATSSENQAYINESLNPSAANSQLYFLVENAWMKRLNDKVIKDKDLVTSLTNYHKDLFLKNLDRRAPQTRARLIAQYSDFKSIRAVIDSPDQHIVAEIERVFLETNKEFFNSPLLRQILRAEDLDPRWFTLGFGFTNDQASLAAKAAREHPRLVEGFWNPEFQKEQTRLLYRAQQLHLELEQLLQDEPLWHHGELRLNVFAYGRKAESAEQLLSFLKTEYPRAHIDLEEATLIFEFIEIVDGFTPSMLIAMRETLTLHEALHGAISLDFIGLGAENLKGTARAIVQAKDVSDALNKARIEERTVTRSFKQRQDNVRKTVMDFFNGEVSIRFSGDDGIIIPRVEFMLRRQLQLLQSLTQNLVEPLFRLAVINGRGAQSAMSSELISHAEGIEKRVRPLILQLLGPEVARSVHIQVFNPDIEENRSVFLMLNTLKELSPNEKMLLRQAFTQAVNEFESGLIKQSSPVRYEPTEIFLVAPSTPTADDEL